MTTDHRDPVANRPPLTGPPGAHPLATGVDAAVGGQAAEKVTATVDPAHERADRNAKLSARDCVECGPCFGSPAYRFGLDARGRYPGREFDEVEFEMSIDWATGRGASILNWAWAKHAARDAWNRISPSSSPCV